MQKISPLRSSIEAFNKFKALRANKTDKAQKTEQQTQTNPFGITFKGNMIQMDVFEKTEKTEKRIQRHLEKSQEEDGRCCRKDRRTAHHPERRRGVKRITGQCYD